MPKLTIGVDVGMTIKIGGDFESDFVKPRVHAQLQFEELPSETEMTERWKWLWDKQIAPQSEQLLDMLTQQITQRLANRREPVVSQRAPAVAPPPEATYD